MRRKPEYLDRERRETRQRRWLPVAELRPEMVMNSNPTEGNLGWVRQEGPTIWANITG